mmetsp:Transcript_6612/g.16428  ORF Transcript_6612/g.16428 Transcript_6612/m.16428 type:complete len:226 (+) Transcript_6612:689-1366(+)
MSEKSGFSLTVSSMRSCSRMQPHTRSHSEGASPDMKGVVASHTFSMRASASHTPFSASATSASYRACPLFCARTTRSASSLSAGARSARCCQCRAASTLVLALSSTGYQWSGTECLRARYVRMAQASPMQNMGVPGSWSGVPVPAAGPAAPAATGALPAGASGAGPEAGTGAAPAAPAALAPARACTAACAPSSAPAGAPCSSTTPACTPCTSGWPVHHTVRRHP